MKVGIKVGPVPPMWAGAREFEEHINGGYHILEQSLPLERSEQQNIEEEGESEEEVLNDLREWNRNKSHSEAFSIKIEYK
jgi:hypothetical protein